MNSFSASPDPNSSNLKFTHTHTTLVSANNRIKFLIFALKINDYFLRFCEKQNMAHALSSETVASIDANMRRWEL